MSLIAEEFWQQGDLERQTLNAPSSDLMNRYFFNVLHNSNIDVYSFEKKNHY